MKSFILLFLLLLQSDIYLPIIRKPDTTLYGERVGLSWSTQKWLNGVDAKWHYNGRIHDQEAIDGGEIPMCWCDDNSYKVCENIPDDYTGYALAINEPGGPKQCNRLPAATAAIMRHYLRTWPNIKWVMPNMLRPWLLKQTLDAYEEMYGEYPDVTVGIHIYDYTWLDFKDPTELIDRYVAILEERGMRITVWVTEYNICNTRTPYQDMYDWTKSIAEHPNVDKFAPFTAVNSIAQWPCRSDLYWPNGTLTERGQGFYDATHQAADTGLIANTMPDVTEPVTEYVLCWVFVIILSWYVIWRLRKLS